MKRTTLGLICAMIAVPGPGRAADPSPRPVATSGGDSSAGHSSSSSKGEFIHKLLDPSQVHLENPSCDWQAERKNREETKRFTTWPINVSLGVAQISLATTAMSALGYFGSFGANDPYLHDRAGLVFKYSVPVTLVAWAWYAFERQGARRPADERAITVFDLRLAQCPPDVAGWQ
jgi:hypothetical protein